MSEAYRYLCMEEAPPNFLKKIIKALVQMLPRRWMLWQGKGDKSEIAITFDDGPDPIYTPQILEILKRYGVKATFFLVGEKIARHKELVERILAEGHEVGNHSYTHPSFNRLSWKEAMVEIGKTQSLIQAIQGCSCRLFRPPFGKLCLASTFGAWVANLTCTMWNVDLKDFQANSSGEILAALKCQPLQPGDVILYHGTNPHALKALPDILETIGRQERQPVRISEMLGVR